MNIMAGLLADFMIEVSVYVNENLDDFSWRWADVYLADSLGKRCDWGYFCRTMEAAMKKKDGFLEKYPEVAVRNNTTRKGAIYKSKEKLGK